MSASEATKTYMSKSFKWIYLERSYKENKNHTKGMLVCWF